MFLVPGPRAEHRVQVGTRARQGPNPGTITQGPVGHPPAQHSARAEDSCRPGPPGATWMPLNPKRIPFPSPGVLSPLWSYLMRHMFRVVNFYCNLSDAITESVPLRLLGREVS